ncbi:hypothetical protein PC9H_011248 [Pleurotus ostreatus]|uniref:Uncharacterized protein n=1 Tax=Pleurotus ostreatus TaxID=5322 RepID=A0A8H7DLA0_PLEOS|nr:uncharacterized protein PC9H_011248 [Pleurotus ostreatus]KAF7420730.1 hypothetical protein PC9H_011248 [Pleurotus ostreatus]
MSCTTTIEQVQKRMPLATDTTAVPPVQQKPGCEGPVWVPLRVCGFLYSYDDLVAYAEKYLPDDLEKERSKRPIRDYRRQRALKHIKNQLENLDYVLVQLADGEVAKCMLVGSNYDEEELAKARHLDRIAKFRKVLAIDSTCEPKWYRLGRSAQHRLMISEERAYPDMLIEYVYEIDLDDEVFWVNGMPIFRLDCMPMAEVFLEVLGKDIYPTMRRRRAWHLSMGLGSLPPRSHSAQTWHHMNSSADRPASAPIFGSF